MTTQRFDPIATSEAAREAGADPLAAVLVELVAFAADATAEDRRQAADDVTAWARGCGESHHFPPFAAGLDPDELVMCDVCGLRTPGAAAYLDELAALASADDEAVRDAGD